MLNLATLLASNRVKALILAVVLGYLKQKFPEFAPDPDTINLIYYAIIAFICGDSYRPVDPSKRRHAPGGQDFVRNALREFLGITEDQSTLKPAPASGQSGPAGQVGQAP